MALKGSLSTSLLFAICLITGIATLAYVYQSCQQYILDQQLSLARHIGVTPVHEVESMRQELMLLADRIAPMEQLPQGDSHPLLSRTREKYPTLVRLMVLEPGASLQMLVGPAQEERDSLLSQQIESESYNHLILTPGKDPTSPPGILLTFPLPSGSSPSRLLVAEIEKLPLNDQSAHPELMGIQMIVNSQNRLIWRSGKSSAINWRSSNFRQQLPAELQQIIQYPEDLIADVFQNLGGYWLVRQPFGYSQWHLIQVIPEHELRQRMYPYLMLAAAIYLFVMLLVWQLWKSRTQLQETTRNWNYLDSLFRLSSIPQLLVDVRTNRLIKTNRAASRLFGFPRKTLAEIPFNQLCAPQEATDGKARFGGEIRKARLAGNKSLYLEVLPSIPADRHSDVQHYFVLYSETLEQESKDIRYQAYYDPLTELPNRNFLFEHLPKLLATHKREGQRFAVLFVDLDRFKQVNDGLGHDIGDDVLKVVAERLSSRLRESDMLARLGGDEFTVILPQLRDDMDASQVARAIVGGLSTPITVSGYDISIGASVGIAIYPRDGESPAELLKNADVAMYQAKDLGRGGYCFFEPPMNAALNRKAQLESDIRTALEQKQMLLELQPIFDVNDLTVVGAEALMRWQHPQLGLLQPPEFLSVAEETGQIGTIGHWVLSESLSLAETWLQDNRIKQGFFLAINVSQRQLLSARHLNAWLDTVNQSPFPNNRLVLELDRNCYSDDSREIQLALQSIAQAGVKLALDDFASGSTTLRLVRDLPIDSVKVSARTLDRSDQTQEVFLKALMAFARSLNINIMAVDIETRAQLDLFRNGNCQFVQGYLFSPAVPSARFAAQLQSGFKPSVSQE